MRRRTSALVVIGVVSAATSLSLLGVRARADAPPAASGPPAVTVSPQRDDGPPAVTVSPQRDDPPEAPRPDVAPAGGPSTGGSSAAAGSLEDEPVPAQSERVVAYTLAAELFPETHTVRGTGTIVWRNSARVATDRLYVHLYLNAFKNDRTVFWRVPVSAFRGYPLDGPGHIEVERFFVRELGKDVWPEKATSPGDPDDATDIEVPLARAIEPGESLTIDIGWTSHLPTVTLRTGYSGSFHMVAQWFPKLARLEPDGTWAHFPFQRLSEFYADYGSYDVTLDTPESFMVGAVGALVSEAPVETTAQVVDVPPAPSVSAASPASVSAAASASVAPSADIPLRDAAPAAPRTRRRFTAEDVHDFAFTAWDGFRSIEETTPAGVKLRCLFPEGYEEPARIQLDAVRFGLGYFGAAFGRYPYGTLTIVHPPWGAGEAGGMEYPTLITTGGTWRKGFVESRELEIVTLHELAHQWFYGLVGSNENRWPFLDEGITSYAEEDACEAMWPDASAGQGFGFRVGLPALYRVGAMQATRNARPSDAAGSFVSGMDYSAMVYSRTETTLRTLANVYGESALRGAVGRYARRYRFAHPTPDDFFAVMRERLGAEAEEALRVALTERSSVDYVAAEVASERRTDGAPGYVGHALVRRRGEVRLPVDVLLIDRDGGTKTVRWDAKLAADRITYEGTAPLVAAVVDPDHRVLLDEDLSNNAVRAGGSRFAWRLLEAGAFAGGVAARGLLP